MSQKRQKYEAFEAWKKKFRDMQCKVPSCENDAMQDKKRGHRSDLCVAHKKEGFSVVESFARNEITLEQLRQFASVRGWMLLSESIIRDILLHKDPNSAEMQEFAGWLEEMKVGKWNVLPTFTDKMRAIAKKMDEEGEEEETNSPSAKQKATPADAPGEVKPDTETKKVEKKATKKSKKKAEA